MAVKESNAVCSPLALGLASVLTGWLGSVPAAQWDLYTVANTNELMRVDPDTCAATTIGITQDSVTGPVRRIRGLAYDPTGTMYGITREGDLVTVDLFSAMTTDLNLSVDITGIEPFWSGLAFRGAPDNALYAANASGHELVRIDLNTMTSAQAGCTGLAPSCSTGQILGLDFHPDPLDGRLYAANRTNHNIVELVPDPLNPTSSVLYFTWGGATSGVLNPQAIAFHPESHVLYGICESGTFSSERLVTYSAPGMNSTTRCILPFGILENVGGGEDTYGWGGLAFAPCGNEDGWEENDTCGDSAALPPFATWSLFVSKLDRDWYRMLVPARSKLNVYMYFAHADGDIDVRLYKKCGGALLFSGEGSNDNEAFVWTNLGHAAREVFLQVRINDSSVRDCNYYGLGWHTTRLPGRHRRR